MKPKQKSVTMWAIWSPHWYRFVSMEKTKRQAWEGVILPENFYDDDLTYWIKQYKKEGYRAVKGKFVWEEK